MLLEGLLLACLGETTTGSTSGNETYQAGGLVVVVLEEALSMRGGPGEGSFQWQQPLVSDAEQ